MTSKKFINVCEPYVGAQELDYVTDCIKSGWISSESPYVKKFEDGFAKDIGAQNGIAVANGTAALEVALYAAGVNEGDEVILPSFTIISCFIAVVRLGAIPVLVDVDPCTWNLTIDHIQKKITPKTKAILVVHTYGHPVDMDPIINIALEKNIKIVEDVAESYGAEYKGKKCGTFGVSAAFSLYANKFITTGEGGMVLTNDDEAENRARYYRNLCFNSKERFSHEDIGYNFRMSGIQAAFGLGQLDRVDKIIETKIKMGELYKSFLSEIPGIKLQKEKPWAKMVYWMYAIEINPSLNMLASELMQKLKEKKIGSRPFFKGLHDQPAIKKKGYKYNQKEFPVTEQAYKYGLYLPSGLMLTNAQIEYVCMVVKDELVK